MTTMKRTSFRVLTNVIISLVLLGLFFIPLINSSWFAKIITLHQFEKYQKKELFVLDKENNIWKSQNIDNYRLQLQVITHEYYYDSEENPRVSSRCTISLDIQNKNTVSIFENTCGKYTPLKSIFRGWEMPNLIPDLNTPPSMDDLFVSIRNTFTNPWCGPNGCECDGYYTYSVEYDSSLGYPKLLKVTYVDALNTQFSRIFCTLAGAIVTFPDYKISILQLP